jgi:predicted transport protein
MLVHDVVGYECLAGNVVDEAITPDVSNQITSEEPPVKRILRGLLPMPPTKAAVTPLTFAVHVAYTEPSVRPVLHELRRRITALGPGIKENVTAKQRITYGLAHAFVEIKVQKEKILVRVHDTGLAEPQGIGKKFDKKDRRWSHDLELSVDTIDRADYAMPFVEASYRRELSR